MKERGWWSLEIKGVKELTQADREHIAKKIEEGYKGGEVVQ